MTTAKSEIHFALTWCNIQVVIMMVQGPKGIKGYDHILKQFTVIITIIRFPLHSSSVYLWKAFITDGLKVIVLIWTDTNPLQ